LDAEHYFQTGQFAGRQISTFGGAGESGFSRKGALRPRAGVRWLYGSGDGDAADRTSGTFVGPISCSPCCIDPLWLAPSNLAVLGSFVSPHRDVIIEGKVDVMRRLRETDAIYAFPQVAYPGSLGQHGNQIGVAAGVSVTWTPAPEIRVELQHLEQSAEGALENAGARDGRYTVASLALRF
jgi:hypothetical protein